MLNALVIIAFLFFLGLSSYMGLAGRSFWFIPLLTLFTFTALNLHEIVGPAKVGTLANTIGLSVLTYLIYLVPITVAFLAGFLIRYLTKASFGGPSATWAELGIMIIVAVSLFAGQSYLSPKTDNPAETSQPPGSE